MRRATLLSLALIISACPEKRARLTGTFATVTETFAQRPSGQPLDLLFVVDNSKSMAPAQQRLGEGLVVFFDWINRANVDYRIAVTSTDAVGVTGSRPAVRGRFSSLGGVSVVQKTTPAAVSVMAANVNLGIDGTNTEQGVFTAMQALGLLKSQRGVPPQSNAGFLRPNARLGVIFVTDEDDHSSIDIGSFIFALRDLKGLGNHDAVFLGAVVFDAEPRDATWVPWHPERTVPGTCSATTSDQATSYAYLDLVQQSPFPASVSSICGDFAPTLRRMAIEAAGFQTRFRLAQQADPTLEVTCGEPGALCVRVDGAELSQSQFRYDEAANQLVFDGEYVPPLGAKIEVDFGVITRFGRQEDSALGAFSACTTEADCPVGVACSAGKCILKCSQADHCRAGFSCSSSGACQCVNDSSCATAEVCMPSGACQPRARCTNSSGCAANQFCEAVSGECRAIGTCAIPPGLSSTAAASILGSLSCPRGQVCEGTSCRAGCVNDTSCPNGQTCRWDGGVFGTCAVGCRDNDDCCTGQLCNASGQCVAAPGSVDGGAVIPLCDRTTCQNNGAVCRNAGGTCGAIYDTDFGCVPGCTNDAQCAKGYSCEHATLLITRCMFGGPACAMGRTCSATLESPEGTCSCTSDTECGSSGTCYTYGNGERYCRTRVGACYPRYECAQLRSGEQLVCNDLF